MQSPIEKGKQNYAFFRGLYIYIYICMYVCMYIYIYNICFQDFLWPLRAGKKEKEVFI